MNDGVSTYLRDVWTSVRLADLLDIFVVAVLVYGIMTWFRKSRSRFVMMGFGALVLLYFAAKLLGMYLTLFLFQVGITVAVVALVIIFQEEIRRGFERLATRRPFLATRKALLAPDLVDTIVEAGAHLAHHKIGALIVLKGREPLERHTTGGVLLDGRVTEQLLYSIFDPSSDGHDGAVVIEDGLVTKFATHLPLSTNLSGIEKLGTRHTAALGLSERSDALVIAVSEEQGAISIAHGGRLQRLEAVNDLKNRLESFIAQVSPRQPSSPWKRFLASDLGTKGLSLAIAAIAWLVVFGYQSEVVARTFSVPIVFRNVPNGWMLDEPKPHEANVTLSGSSRAFRLLNPEKLTVPLDVANPKAGWQGIKINESALSLPDGLTVEHLDTNVVRFEAYPTTTIEVPIRPRTKGKMTPGIKFHGIEVEPKMASIVVRKRDKNAIKSVPTEPVDLTGMTETTTVPVALELPDDVRLAKGMGPLIDVTTKLSSKKQK